MKKYFLSFGLLLTVGLATVVFNSCEKQQECEACQHECPDCECPECDCPKEDPIIESGDSIVTCVQAYYPTDDCHIFYYLGGFFYEQGKTNDTNHNGYALQSQIWTFSGTPGISRFFLYFDLSDYNYTKKTLIESTSLYLYAHPILGGHASNTPTNKHVFNRVVGDWEETTITWNNQPDVDETTNVTTDHIPGSLNNSSKTDYVFNLNNILLENGKLKADYKGISCRPYQENVNDYYRGVTFASREIDNKALFPTLKVEYTLPLPKIKFSKDIFCVISSEDLNALFENVQYVWTINGEESTGEYVIIKNTTENYTVDLQIIVTNNIGEISTYTISKTF